jgi:hypothetical protein
MRPSALLALAAALLGAAAPLAAQNPAAQPPRDTTPAPRPRPGGAPPQGSEQTNPPFDFSGVIFGNYQVRTDATAKGQTGGKAPNAFSVDRVYLTYRQSVGDRASVRVTTDIFPNGTNGWDLRLKYGYLQYDFLRDIGGHKGFNALARVGMLHTVVVDHEEQFWPRYLSQVAVERYGFFASADLGVASQVSLPNKWGEVYGTITNGPGFTAPETDRFKDFALRLSLTPLSKQTDLGLLKSLTISPWVYKGWTGSKFANGGTGQIGPVTEGLARDRWGIFTGVRNPSLTIAVHYARRTEGFESGANTPASPRVAAPDSTGEVWSAYTVAHPLHWRMGKNVARLGAVLRWDQFTPRTSVPGHERFVIAGLQFEPTTHTALALDYQDLAPQGFASTAPINESRAWFLHWSATF